MTDREARLLKALIEITEYYQAFRHMHEASPSPAIRRARAIIKQFDHGAFVSLGDESDD